MDIKITDTVTVSLDGIVLEYKPSFIFDESSSDWNPSPEYNVIFLRSIVNHLNNKYQAQGHLFLNEVYDMLHMPRTGAGAVLGWMYGERERLLLDYELNEEDGSFVVTVNPTGIIVDEL